MKKVAIVIGTRPEAIKLLPLYIKLKESDAFDPHILFTGQHEDMVHEIFDLFQVSAKYTLKTMFSGQTLGKLTANLCIELDSLYESEPLDIVIIQGDTTSAFIASLIGFYHQLEIVHVEAGLRTRKRNSPFPEEINRQLIGRLATLHFAPTQTALDNLKVENIQNCFLTGNTGIDALELIQEYFVRNRGDYISYFENKIDFNKPIVLVTAHRRENHGKKFDDICNAIVKISKAFDKYQFVYPVHPNPSIKNKARKNLNGLENVILMEPLPYDKLLFLLKESKIALSDSGGIQEEAPSFNTPLLVLRDTTERPEGIAVGCAFLVGTDTNLIVESFNAIAKDEVALKRMIGIGNPYGDGKASGRIVKIMENFF